MALAIILISIGVCVSLFRPVHAYSADAFVMMVNVSGTNQFEIRTLATGGQSFNVDCDDNGTNEWTNRNANTTCTYPSAGTYTIAITGNFRRITYNNNAEAQKIRSIEQWGTTAWSSMENAFYGASNMVLNATDMPNLTSPATMNLSHMFRGTTALVDNGGMMSLWNTSKVTTTQGMFRETTLFNQNIGNWDTSNVIDMSYMFNAATAFTNDGASIGGWNTGSVTNTSSMFQGATSFNQPIGSWNVGSVTNMTNMFNGATSFNQPLGLWNTGNVTQMTNMFAGATSFNQPLGGWDVGSADNPQYDNDCTKHTTTNMKQWRDQYYNA